MSKVETAVKLSRKPLEVAGLKSLTDDALMAEVKDVLGYGQVDKAVTLKKVTDIFKELDIEPFDPVKVAAYKKSESSRITKTYYRDYNRVTTHGYWKSTPLNQYQREIPAFALLRATQIKKALNAANIESNFQIEELTKKSQSFVYDPFMVLHVAGKKLYIDVWNEPKFEGRRTK